MGDGARLGDAFGTLAAFAVALRLLAKELAARREVEGDRRRSQARLVSAWTTPNWPEEYDLESHIIVTRWSDAASDGEPTNWLLVRNGSDEPVFEVDATVVHHLSPSAADPEAACWEALELDESWEGVNLGWSIMPPHEMKGAPLSNSYFPDWHVVIRLPLPTATGVAGGASLTAHLLSRQSNNAALGRTT